MVEFVETQPGNCGGTRAAGGMADRAPTELGRASESGRRFNGTGLPPSKRAKGPSVRPSRMAEAGCETLGFGVGRSAQRPTTEIWPGCRRGESVQQMNDPCSQYRTRPAFRPVDCSCPARTSRCEHRSAHCPKPTGGQGCIATPSRRRRALDFTDPSPSAAPGTTRAMRRQLKQKRKSQSLAQGPGSSGSKLPEGSGRAVSGPGRSVPATSN